MAEIKVMSSLAMKAALIELAPRYEKESGDRVTLQWVGGADIAKRLKAGEACDVVVAAASTVNGLAKEGLVAADSVTDLVRSKIGVAVRPGAPRPDLSSADSLRRALMTAKTIAYSSGPSGVYLVEVFKRWEIPSQKLKQAAPGAPAGEIVARGEAEIGFQQVSELLPVKGIDYVGELPAGVQHVTVFSAGTNAKSEGRERAATFTCFLTSRGVVPALAKHGLEPV